MDIEWALSCHTMPPDSGYYMALYWNERFEQWLYKPLIFNADTMKWEGPWAWSYDVKGPYTLPDGTVYNKYVHKGLLVDKWVVGSRTQYYGEQFRHFLNDQLYCLCNKEIGDEHQEASYR